MSLGDEFMMEVRKKFAAKERIVLVQSVRAAYEHIMRTWPVWSGYSKANNKISVTGRAVTSVSPQNRILKKGAHVAKAAQVQSTELGKLERIEHNFGMKNRTIIIGNAVDYAADMPASALSGREIYEQAAAIGRTHASALAKD